jgi:hypothetical protein
METGIQWGMRKKGATRREKHAEEKGIMNMILFLPSLSALLVNCTAILST